MTAQENRSLLTVLHPRNHLPLRPPQANIPPTHFERNSILEKLRNYIKTRNLVPPLTLDELRTETAAFIKTAGIDGRYRDFTGVLLNNELWKETLASIPYARRLLLLPKCLRVEDHCPAPFDELGLLCKKCGMCSIQDLQEEAEKLGYAVLVAEGSPIVMALIETGKIQAIVGVSCLNVLEKVYPYMEAAAVPGVAIPLLHDDCKDTAVDLDWVWEAIHLSSNDRSRRMDLGALREEVESWFRPELLSEILGKPADETEAIGHCWLARAGKRWRPFLTVAMHQALAEKPDADIPYDLRRVALAVECFHKASLIHDDIEDADRIRYGESTLHEVYGIPVALNVGDYLLGEGYRLLAECEATAECRAAMLRAASQGHRTLSLGQGAELCWSRAPRPLAPREVIEIFRRKTAPAFEVALRLGAIYSGAERALDLPISPYSDALGIAYQIRDDLEEYQDGSERGGEEHNGGQPFDDGHGTAGGTSLRPTLPLSLAYEKAVGEEKTYLKRIWCRETKAEPSALLPVLRAVGALDRSYEVLEACKEEAVRSLKDLDSVHVKGLLRRVVGKIFNDLEIQGWCSEFEARNAPSGEVGI